MKLELAAYEHFPGKGRRRHILVPDRKTIVLCQNTIPWGYRPSGEAYDPDNPPGRLCKNCKALAERITSKESE